MKKLTYLATILLLVIALTYWFETGIFQHKPAPRVISLIQLTEVDNSTVAGFKAGMAAAGYHEGQNIIYLSSGPAGYIDRLDAIIHEHLRKQPDLIMVSSTPATQAVKRLIRDGNIPVVFAPVNDPVGSGIISNLRHPGGHITGVRLPTGDDLRLKWLSEIAPQIRKVFVPFTPGDASAQTTLKTITAAAPGLNIELLSREVLGEDGVKATLNTLPEDVDAIFLPRDSSVESYIDSFVSYAIKHRMPLSAPSYTQVTKGALMSYGYVHEDIGRQAARMANQIFLGISPGSLPVEMAESILTINTASAERIGLTIPDKILQQAEKIIRE